MALVAASGGQHVVHRHPDRGSIAAAVANGNALHLEKQKALGRGPPGPVVAG
jgi:hypothetical protein